MKAKLYQAELQLSASQQAQQRLQTFLQLGQILLSFLDASSAGLRRVYSPPESAITPEPCNTHLHAAHQQ